MQTISLIPALAGDSGGYYCTIALSAVPYELDKGTVTVGRDYCACADLWPVL